MAHSNYITIFLKLQELSVLNVRDIGEKIEIEVIRKWDYAVCPSCGRTTSRKSFGASKARYNVSLGVILKEPKPEKVFNSVPLFLRYRDFSITINKRYL